MVFSESIILSGNYNWDLKLKSWIGGCFTAKLCWRATRDGWAASTFHANCDYKKPTVTIVKVGQYVFGGYATESWEGEINETSFNVTSIVQIFSLGLLKFLAKKGCARARADKKLKFPHLFPWQMCF